MYNGALDDLIRITRKIIEVVKLGKKKADKSLPIGIKLLLILLFSCSVVAFAVSAAFAFQDVYSLAIAVPSGIAAFVILMILLKDYKPADKAKSKKKTPKKTTKWYVDKIIAALVLLGVVFAVFLIAVGAGENEPVMYAGFLLSPLISILIAPNAVLYALKDMKDWKGIFYGKGNLGSFKDNKVFYWVKTPVAFEKRLFWAVVKDQILNIGAAITLMVFAAGAGLFSILTYDSHSVAPGDILGAIFYVRVRRGTGVMAFILLLVVVFGFPLFVYYITNAINKLRIIAGHKYMAYHAVVKSVNTYKVRIDSDGRTYEYKYGTLVGMREKQVQDTPATLIFIPDDVLIFPDEVFEKHSA